MQMNKHVVVFVPGMLGSELIFEGSGPTLRPIHEPVWSGDFAVLIKTLTSSPERLHLPNPLSTGRVIRQVKPPGVPPRSVYAKLLDRLEATGYKNGISLFPFPYDWRLSNVLTARNLALFVRSMIPDGAKISYITHSMGGLIVRIMLSSTENDDIKSRTASLIQIGIPALGSSKAFYTLQKEPSFGGLMQFLLKVNSHVRPDAYHRLLDAVRTFDSLYELLPHDTERFLVSMADENYNAFDNRFWSTERASKLPVVGDVHKQVRAFSFPPLLTIYSDDIETDKYYQVDINFKVEGTYGCVNGDGTVSVSSAVHGSILQRRYALQRRVLHDDIQNHPDALALIESELNTHGTA